MGGEIVSSTLTLLLLLALLAGATLLARRLRLRLPGAKDSGITLSAPRALGGQNMLVIAEAEGQRVLLGVSRGGITLLARLNHD